MPPSVLSSMPPSWPTHVGRHLIELAGRDVVVIIPSDAAIGALVHAAIVADKNDARILRVDPECVIVGVGARDRGPRLAAVDRNLARVAADENLLVVVRVDADLAEVHRALILIAHELPGLAAVFGAEDAAGVGIGRRL